MPKAEAKRPKPVSVDSLFGVGKDGIASLPIDQNLIPFSKHPFHLYEGERLADMVHSIKTNGVLNPIIVRGLSGRKYEILSGHNRVNASKMAGLHEIPAIIKSDLTDDDAWVYVIETNLLQRSFSDMSYSEKAIVLSTHYSKMFSQGKRNDILDELRQLEGLRDKTSPQVGAKLRSDEKVGAEYGLSKNTVSRYLRISKLIPDLLAALDAGAFAFMPAVTISFLSEKHQQDVFKCLGLNGFSLDIRKADLLREYADNQALNSDTIFTILSGEIKKPALRNDAPLRIKNSIIKKHFKPDTSAEEIQNVIDKALTLYFKSK